MMLSQKWHTLRAAWQYYWRADTRYNIHSPYVFSLLQHWWHDPRHFYIFEEADYYYQQLLANDTLLNVTDFGAGTGGGKPTQRRIKDIAASAVSPPAKGRMLFRLVNWHKPRTLLEIGGSLGIATLYQSAGARHSPLITLEGCPEIANVARYIYQKSGYTHIQQLVGEFSNTLPQALAQLGSLDYVYMDGNHQYAPTLAYFEQCLPFLTENACVVIDDIYWSEGMTAAWHALSRHPRVRVAIDTFQVGVLLLQAPTATEVPAYVTAIPARYKPWRIGIWG